jgi:hypothetical protein
LGEAVFLRSSGKIPFMSDKFISPSFGEMNLDEVVKGIVDFLNSDPDSFYRLVIGTDSQDRVIDGVKLSNFVTAVVIHRKGKGGRYFWKNGKKEKMATLRDKIYAETLLSVEIASNLVPKLQEKLNGRKNWELEIHVDVGKAGKTREMINEVVGMVTGNGYHAKTKPDSYGASSIADKHA